MRSVLRTGMTLMVILLLFLAFNLTWVSNLPDVRWDLSQHKIHTLSPPARQLLATLEDGGLRFQVQQSVDGFELVAR
ncbi:hypothetical protein B7453_22045 [Pseudomonas sp. IB20]|nr:hypothetical protein B7453_22045 [Pseudomonas sp. IB20]